MAACAHVGQEQFDSEIAALRAEMEQATGDSSGSNRRKRKRRWPGWKPDWTGSPGAFPQLEGEFDVTVQRLETAVRFDMPVYFAFDRSESATRRSSGTRPLRGCCG